MGLRLGKFGAKKSTPARRHAVMASEEEGSKFRRGRSLSGSLVDELPAPAEDRGQLQSARVEAQHKRARRRYLGRRLGILSLWLCLLGALYAHYVSHFTAQVSGQPPRPPVVRPYQESAEHFRGSSLGNAFSFSLNKEELANYLLQQHKEIAAVKVVTRPFSKTPQLIVTLRQPVLRWQTRSDPQPFYVDTTGTTFLLDAWQTTQLVTVNDESGVGANLGSPVASSRQISFLGQFVGQIGSASSGKLVITKIVFPLTSTKEIDVYFKDKPYFAKVYLERAPRAQADATVRGVSELEKRGVTPAHYIDVRVAERVFYK